MIRFQMFPLSMLIALGLVAGCASPPRVEKGPVPPLSAERNRCLLESEDCPVRKMTIIELMDGLRHELARGEAVYTPGELRRLEERLQEYEFFYDRLMFGNND